MRLHLCIAVCVLALASGALAGIGPGAIETSLGGSVHLSPEPWEIDANMYLLYYLNNMLGVGPTWSLEKTGDTEDEYGETCTHPLYYTVGAIAKAYLPMTMAMGKMTPYVGAMFGITTVPTVNEDYEDDTENKPMFAVQVGFDYWLTENWTFWTAYRGEKVMADEDEFFDWENRDVSKFMSSIQMGISVFLVK